jgi:hypothetical protein
MISAKSREHRMRVLENLEKSAAQPEMTPKAGVRDGQGDAGQMRMPLLGEIKGCASAKRRTRRTRGKARNDQPELGKF